MNRVRTVRVIGIFICLPVCLSLCVFAVYFFSPIPWRSQIFRWVLLPRKVSESWVIVIELHESYSEKMSANYEELLKRDNEKRREFVRVYQAGQGKCGLVHTGSTIEGDPIVEWILVEEGKLLLIEDWTKDRYGGFPGVHRFFPVSASLGYFEGGKFIEHDPGTDFAEIRVVVRGPKFSYRYF